MMLLFNQVSEIKQISMLLVLSSAYKAGAASGLTIERALRIMHLGTILAAVGSLDILTGMSVRNWPLPLFTIDSLLLLSNSRGIITGILRAIDLNLSRTFLPALVPLYFRLATQ